MPFERCEKILLFSNPVFFSFFLFRLRCSKECLFQVKMCLQSKFQKAVSRLQNTLHAQQTQCHISVLGDYSPSSEKIPI